MRNNDIAGSDIIANSDFANVEMAKAFGNITTGTPVDGSAIIIKERGRLESLNHAEVEKNTTDHESRFAAFIHGQNFRLTNVTGRTRFPHAIPNERTTHPSSDVAKEGSTFVGSDSLAWGRSRRVLWTPISISVSSGGSNVCGTINPCCDAGGEGAALSKPNTVDTGATETLKDTFGRFQMLVGRIAHVTRK